MDIGWCCQPHGMGHGQHFNLKMDLDAWVLIGILDFIDRSADDVPSISAWTVWWDAWPLVFPLLLCEYHAAPPSQKVYRHTHQIQGDWDTQSRCQNTSECSGIDIAVVIASKMFLNAMTDLFGNRCASWHTALHEIHFPWVKYHLVVDHKGADKDLGLWGPLWPFESSYLSNVARRCISCNIFVKWQENV